MSARDFIMQLGTPDSQVRQALRGHGFKLVKRRRGKEEVWQARRGSVIHTVNHGEEGSGWSYHRNTIPDYNFSTGPENMIRNLPRYVRNEAKEFIKGAARAQLVHNAHQNFDYSVQSIYGYMMLKIHSKDPESASVVGAESHRVDKFLPLALDLIRKELPQLKTLDFNDRVVDWQPWFERLGFRLRHRSMGGNYFHWYFVDLDQWHGQPEQNP